MIEFIYNDGGRIDAHYKGKTGDCVTRAITIATGKPYEEVYDAMFEGTRELAKGRGKHARKAQESPSPRSGVLRKVYDKYLLANGFMWVATMQIGSGCRVHVRKDELPNGIIIVRLSKHVACIKDGVLYDTYDSSRNGTRCVYGYYKKL